MGVGGRSFVATVLTGSPRGTQRPDRVASVSGSGAAGPAPQCRMILDIIGSLLMTSAMTAC
jgi:hypothetical protein